MRVRTVEWFIGGVMLLVALLLAPGAQSRAPESWQTISPGGDTRCATGTPYSFHVREGDPARVMFFFNGGGGCWTGDHCDVATEPTTYVPFAEMTHNDPRTHGGAFDLANASNPFLEWTQVFVSYCTGDVHLGAKSVTYTTTDGREVLVHHQGRRNAQAALDWAYARTPEPELVFVGGGSAGSIASPLYAAMVAEHWPDARVVQFGGGSGGYRAPGMRALMETWGLFDALPDWPEAANLAQTGTDFDELYVVAAQRQPGIRFARFDAAYDSVQEDFMRLLGGPEPLYEPLHANNAELRQEVPAVRTYVAGGEAHTLLRYDRLYDYVVDDMPVLDWINALIEGSPVRDVDCGSPEQCLRAP